MKNNKPKKDIKNIILCAFLLTIFVVGGFLMAKDLMLSLTGIKTEGVVTKAEQFSGIKGLNLVYTFKDSNDIEYTVTDVYTNNNHPSFHEGQIITIAYDRDNAGNNVIVSEYAYVNLMFALVPLLIVAVFLYGSLRKRGARVPSK